MSDYHCPACGGALNDDDTICRLANGEVWHLSCRNRYLHNAKRHPGSFVGAAAGATNPVMREVPVSTASLMDTKMNEHDLHHDRWARASAVAGAKPVLLEADARIDYMMTPKCFVLRIPVEALANLGPDAHTRLLAMLNAWITEHKPIPASVSVPKENNNEI